MNIKLNNILFNQSINEISNILETNQDRFQDEDLQSLSRATLESVSKFIANSINEQLPDIKDVKEETLRQPLGIIQPQTLKFLSGKSIKGLKINPFQVKGKQIQGLSARDFKFYEKRQVIPVFLTNKQMQNVGGEKNDQEFAAIFYIPAVYAIIKKENIELHKQLFDIKEDPNGGLPVHIAINKLHYELITKDEVETIQKSFISGNSTLIKKIESLQSQRKPTGNDEKITNKKDDSQKSQQNKTTKNQDENQDENQENTNESYNLYKIHENTLSELLFTNHLNEGPKEWFHKVFKTPTSSYTFYNDESKPFNNIDNDIFYDKEKIEALNASVKDAIVSKDSDVDIVHTVETKTILVGHNKYTLLATENKYQELYDYLKDKDGKIDAQKFFQALPDIRFDLDLKTVLKQNDAIVNDSESKRTTDDVKCYLDIYPQNKQGYDFINFSFDNHGVFVEQKYSDISKYQGETFKVKFKTNDNKIVINFINKLDLASNKEINSLLSNDFGKELNQKIELFNSQITDDEDINKINILIFYMSFIEKIFKLHDKKDEFKINEFNYDFDKNPHNRGEVTSDTIDTNAAIIKTLIDSKRDDEEEGKINFAKIKVSDENYQKYCEDILGILNLTNDSDKKISIGFDNPKYDIVIKDNEIFNAFKNIYKDFNLGSKNEEFAKKVHEHYGDGISARDKIFDILISIARGDGKEMPLSGDYKERQEEKKKKGDFLTEFDEVFKKEFKRFNPILNKEYNIKSEEFEGNKYIKEIAKAIKEQKEINIDLDALINSQIKSGSLKSLINSNVVMRKLKEDKEDLTTELEKLTDKDSFEKDLTAVMTKKIFNAIQGIIGNNSSMLGDNKKYSNKLLVEKSTVENVLTYSGIAASIVSGITAFLGFGATAMGFGLVAGTFGIYRNIKLWQKHSEILDSRKKYKDENADAFCDEIIDVALPLVLKCCAIMIVNMYTSALIGIEDKLKEFGITLSYESESVENIYNNIKSNQKLTYKRENLNELGKQIYAEIIDSAYEFKINNPIGKFINQSMIEKILIKTMFSQEMRNKFSKLIDLLQKERKLETSGAIYKLGLRSLLNEENSSTKEIKETIEINKLRVQLAEIITKEIGTYNFKTDLNNSFIKELKKHEKELPDMWTFKDSTKRKQVGGVVIKVLHKVLGMSKENAKNFFEDNANLFENLSITDIDLIIENKKLSYLLNEAQAKFDTFNRIYQIGTDYYIEYQSNSIHHQTGKYIFKVAANQFNAQTGEITSTLTRNLYSGDAAQQIIDKAKDITNNLENNQALVNMIKSAGESTTSGVDGIKFDTNQIDNVVKSHATPAANAPAGTLAPDEQPTAGEGGAAGAEAGTPAGAEAGISAEFQFLKEISQIVGLVNLCMLVVNFIRPILHKNIKTGAEIQKIITDIEWNSLPGVAFAQIICGILVSHKKELEEQGIKIIGELKKPNKTQSVISQEMIDLIRSKNPKKISEDISDKDISEALRVVTSNMCLSIIRKYDKEKYDEIQKDKHSEIVRNGSSGIKFWKTYTETELVNKISHDKKQKLREKVELSATQQEVDNIIDMFIALSKSLDKSLDLSHKSINGKIINENFYKKSLLNLLFEESVGNQDKRITVEDLIDRLKGKGILLYGKSSMLEDDTKKFKEAECAMISAFASYAKTNFGITVTGVEKYKYDNLIRDQIISAGNINAEAKPGEPASPLIAAETKGVGVPTMKQPADISQLILIANLTGGDYLVKLLNALKKPGFIEKLQGKTLTEMLSILQSEEGLSTEALTDGQKFAREMLPKISKQNMDKILNSSKILKIFNKKYKRIHEIKHKFNEHFNVLENEFSINTDKLSLHFKHFNSLISSCYNFKGKQHTTYDEHVFDELANKFLNKVFETSYSRKHAIEKIASIDELESFIGNKNDFDDKFAALNNIDNKSDIGALKTLLLEKFEKDTESLNDLELATESKKMSSGLILREGVRVSSVDEVMREFGELKREFRNIYRY